METMETRQFYETLESRIFILEDDEEKTLISLFIAGANIAEYCRSKGIVYKQTIRKINKAVDKLSDSLVLLLLKSPKMLSENHNLVIKLWKVENLSQKEIHKVSGISEYEVREIISNLKFLQKLLGSLT